MATPAESLESTRQRILDAAEARFHNYGYNKTTMAEIAQDCGMSAANLYRYFDNKEAICAELCLVCLSEDITTLEQILARSDLSSAEKLEHFFTGIFQNTYDKCQTSPHINEMVETVCRHRRDLADNHKKSKHHLIERLLEAAVKEGEFDVEDIPNTATAILVALLFYDIPMLALYDDYETTKASAQHVARVFVRGLRKQ